VERFTAPERGLGGEGLSAADLFAFAVVLAVAALALIDLRYQDDWSGGTKLAMVGIPFAVVYGLAARGGRPAVPPAHRSALFLASLVLLALALGHLTEVLGADDIFGGDSVAWASGAFVVIAAATGVVFRSAACTLAAAIATAILTATFVGYVLKPEDPDGYKWAVGAYFGVACAAGYVLRWLGDLRHSPQLVTAAAVTLAALASFFGFFIGADFEGEAAPLGRGFEALLVAGPLLALAYGLFFRERGPAWAGGVALAAGLATVGGSKPTLLVWPLVLFGAAAVVVLAAAARARASRG
jgi:hypothetical protein